jgi:antirestriction factor ArdC-like protein
MTNFEIIAEYIEQNGIDFDYNGMNLQTFAAWKKEGMSVKKGAKAFIKVDLWTMKLEDEKDKEGKVVLGEDGKPKKVKKFYLKSAALFKEDQVEKIKKGKKAA